MPDISQETHIALLERDIATLKTDQLAMAGQIAAMEIERDKALKWGIGALGAMVLTLGGFIVSFFKDHLK